MTVHEYLEIVDRQIRQKEISEDIKRELLVHIEDQADYYQEFGLSREKAVKRAVEDMGDPVETGIMLDQVHRPRTDVKLLVVFLAISIAVMILQIAAETYNIVDNSDNNIMGLGVGIFLIPSWIFSKSLTNEYFIRPYSMWNTTLILTFCFWIIGNILGENRGWINVELFFQNGLACSVAFFAAVIFHYRNGGYKEIRHLLVLSIGVYAMSMLVPDYFFTLFLVLAYTGILTFAVCRDWFSIEKRKFLIKLWIIPGFMAAIGLRLLYRNVKNGFCYSAIADYMNGNDVPGILMKMFGQSGIVGILLWVGLILMAAFWVVTDIKGLTNEFCSIECLGALLAFAVPIACSLFGILGSGKMERVWFPLFSANYRSNGLGTLFFCLTLGQFLHFQRNDKVTPKKVFAHKKA